MREPQRLKGLSAQTGEDGGQIRSRVHASHHIYFTTVLLLGGESSGSPVVSRLDFAGELVLYSSFVFL